MNFVTVAAACSALTCVYLLVPPFAGAQTRGGVVGFGAEYAHASEVRRLLKECGADFSCAVAAMARRGWSGDSDQPVAAACTLCGLNEEGLLGEARAAER